MVEQGTHKPLDVGSNPTLATLILTPSSGVFGLKSITCGGSSQLLRIQSVFVKMQLPVVLNALSLSSIVT